MKHLANPEMHVLKMTDPSTGEIIGYSRWFIPKSLGGETIPQMSEKAQEIARDPVVFAPRPMNEALYGAFRQLLETSRKRFVKDEDMGELFMLRDFSFSHIYWLTNSTVQYWIYLRFCPNIKDEDWHPSSCNGVVPEQTNSECDFTWRQLEQDIQFISNMGGVYWKKLILIYLNMELKGLRLSRL